MELLSGQSAEASSGDILVASAPGGNKYGAAVVPSFQDQEECLILLLGNPRCLGAP